MVIDASNYNYKSLNEEISKSDEIIILKNCLGQRFIAAGMSDRKITIEGTPGNALGAYLNGAEITVMGNAQDAVGDTMNAGEITVHGNIGDAAGYAMRGGAVYVEGNAGYRAGIHMKAYREKLPVMVIGGRAGSFLGEYQAGGLIIVLGLNKDGHDIVGNYPCTGMHGGRMVLRSDCKNIRFPSQVTASPATEEERSQIKKYVTTYCEKFSLNADGIMDAEFTVIVPDSKNPYRQMYIAN